MTKFRGNRLIYIALFFFATFMMGIYSVSAAGQIGGAILNGYCVYEPINSQTTGSLTVKQVLDILTNNVTNYNAANTAIQINNADGTQYTKFSCPNYVGIVGNSVTDYSSLVAYNTETEDTTGKTKLKLNRAASDDKLSAEDKVWGSFACQYDRYDVSNGTSTLTTQNITVRFVYQQNINNATTSSYSAYIYGGNIRSGQSAIGWMGGENSIPKEKIVNGSCPEYIIPTGNGYVDLYTSGASEAFIIGKSGGLYLKKTTEQPYLDGKQSEKFLTCDYYKGTDYLEVTLNRTFSTILLYSASVKAYRGSVDPKNAILLTVVDKSGEAGETRNAMFEDVFTNEEANPGTGCPPYLKATSLNYDNYKIDFELIKVAPNPKEIFKYYQLAISEAKANQYKSQMYEAKRFLETILNIEKNNNISAGERDRQIRLFVSDYAGKDAPTEVQNMNVYLGPENNGKVSKAIYDYANFWYALASDYSRYYAAESGSGNCYSFYAYIDTCQGNEPTAACDDSQKCIVTGINYLNPDAGAGNSNATLRFVSFAFMRYLEDNIKAGYIPYPDGCDMLSADLISFMSWILRVVHYATLALVIILGMVDFLRAVTESDDKSLQKAGSRFLKRIVALIFMFLAAVFIQFILVNYPLPGISQNELQLCNIV